MYDSLDYDSRCAEIRRMRERQRMMYESLRRRVEAQEAAARAAEAAEAAADRDAGT